MKHKIYSLFSKPSYLDLQMGNKYFCVLINYINVLFYILLSEVLHLKL